MYSARKINTMRLVIDSGKMVEERMKKLWQELAANDLEAVRKGGARLLGILDGLTLTMNAMITEENNEFTGDFGEWLDAKEEELASIGKCAQKIEKGEPVFFVVPQ